MPCPLIFLCWVSYGGREDSEPQGGGGLSPGGIGGQYQHGPGLQDVLRTNLGPNTQ